MTVGICRILLRLPENQSLKGKRQVLKSIISRLRNHYNVSVAEVGENERWQLAALGISCVSNNEQHAQEILSKAMHFIEESRLEAEVIDFQTEILHAL